MSERTVTVYRITHLIETSSNPFASRPAAGLPLEGLVQGNGGLLHGETGLRQLQRAAEGWRMPVHLSSFSRESPPDIGFVRVYHPEQRTVWKDIQIVGATVELVREIPEAQSS
jgi:hypothetical protein